MRIKTHILLFSLALGACATAPKIGELQEITYTIGPAIAGDFNAIDIILDIDTFTYETPHNNGYGVYRFDGTDICFLASYSETERCIDYEVPHTDWGEGDVWAIKSFDGSDAVVSVKSIK